MKTPKKFIIAHAYVRDFGKIICSTIRVPVTMRSIPTVPLVIKYEKDYYVKTSNNPLEYSSASFGKGVKA